MHPNNPSNESDRMSVLDSTSEVGESDASSIDITSFRRVQTSQLTRDQLTRELESMYTQCAQYRAEINSHKTICKNLREENKMWRKNSVEIQARAEQEGEFISNTLMRKIQELKKGQEKISTQYEMEEERLTNELTRKIEKIRHEKKELEESLVKEHNSHVNILQRHIRTLEAQATAKESALQKLRHDKIDLEIVLENEQEALVNKLCRRIDKLETEKNALVNRLTEKSSFLDNSDQTVSETLSFDKLSTKYITLRSELISLRQRLHSQRNSGIEKVKRLSREEVQIKSHNRNLRQQSSENEKMRRMMRISESESSMDMDDDCLRPESMLSPKSKAFRKFGESLGNPNFTDFLRSSSVSSTSENKEFKAPSSLPNLRDNSDEGSRGSKP